MEVKSFNEQNFDSNFEISEEIHELHLFFQNEATNKKPSVKNWFRFFHFNTSDIYLIH